MKTGVILQSGRFTATPHQLTDALEEHRLRLERGPLDCRVILLTEMSPNKYDNTLVDWADTAGWHVYHPTTARGADECAILSDRPFAWQFYFRLTPLRLSKKQTGRTAPLFVIAARPKGDDPFGVWHSPAHNDGLAHGNWATRVYLSALDGMKQWRMRLRGRPTIGGDWNGDPTRNRRFEDEFRSRFPRMVQAFPKRATEGGRSIDGFLTRRRVLKEATTLAAQPGFDHRPVLIVLG